MIQVIIAVSLIVVVDTYFLVDGILAKIDEIANLNLDKQNELTKVEKGIYSVAKREEISRTQSMSAILDMMLEMKDENSKLLSEIKDDNSKHMKDFMEQDKLMTKIQLKKDVDNTDRVVSSTEKWQPQIHVLPMRPLRFSMISVKNWNSVTEKQRMIMTILIFI